MITRAKRMDRKSRKKHILEKSLSIAVKIGYDNLTKSKIAEEAKISLSLINFHFGTMRKLKSDVLKEAARIKVLEIIGQAIVNKDSRIAKISKDLKQAAIEFIKRQY